MKNRNPQWKNLAWPGILTSILFGGLIGGILAGVRYVGSVSIAEGFYLLDTGRQPAREDVVMWEGQGLPWIEQGADWGYYSRSWGGKIGLAKVVAAVPGDVVALTADNQVKINDRVWGNSAWVKMDGQGHPMPQPKYPMVVPKGQLFVLGTHPASWDSRYYGCVEQERARGVLIPLWTYHSVPLLEQEGGR